ncbi:hypothetical protein [Actinoplanes sp. RD1]|uniref:hypothetical protein n=1 Tax=Actinoplanes sp. RD1 TaxID=3064538 RepID=UPI00274181C0|nr:hypothetical protein [Actinoplanes sp. RD1]
MSDLTSRLDAVHLHASAPAGGVHAELRGDSEITLYLSTGYYTEATESELGRRLEQLGKLLWAERIRAYRRLAEQPGSGVLLIDPDPHLSREDARFVVERGRLVATGASPDGHVTIEVRGMSDWKVTVRPGSLRVLDEDTFTRAVEIAAARMIEDQFMKNLQLKAQAYGEPA